MATRLPRLVVIASGESLLIKAGWKNIAVTPATDAVTTMDTGKSSGQTTTAIVLGGSGDNNFDNIWGDITISSAGGSTNLVIDGYIS